MKETRMVVEIQIDGVFEKRRSDRRPGKDRFQGLKRHWEIRIELSNIDLGSFNGLLKVSMSTGAWAYIVNTQRVRTSPAEIY